MKKGKGKQVNHKHRCIKRQLNPPLIRKFLNHYNLWSDAHSSWVAPPRSSAGVHTFYPAKYYTHGLYIKSECRVAIRRRRVLRFKPLILSDDRKNHRNNKARGSIVLYNINARGSSKSGINNVTNKRRLCTSVITEKYKSFGCRERAKYTLVAFGYSDLLFFCTFPSIRRV